MPIPVTKEYGPRGVATIVTTKSKISVSYLDDQGNFTLLMEDQTPAMREILEDREGKYHVSIDRDHLKIISIAPVSGSYKARFLKFLAAKDTPPECKLRPSSKLPDGKVIPEHMEFTCIYELTSSSVRGMTANYFLTYAFKMGEYEDQKLAILTGMGAQKLEKWMLLHGFNFVEDSIPWSDNILPWLEKEVIKRGKIVQVEMSDKGYIKAIASLAED